MYPNMEAWAKSESLEPKFEKEVIEDNLKDGYWVDSFDVNNNGLPDLIGYGLNSGLLNWYKNPNVKGDETSYRDWEKSLIAEIDEPVGMTHGCIGQDKFNDIVICSKYGETIETIAVDGGEIHWYQNPLANGDIKGVWTKRYIGKAAGMHRLALGYFTQVEKIEVLALPVVGAPHNVHSAIQVKVFQIPDSVYDAPQWKETLITDTYFHLVHDVTIRKFRANFGDLRDSALIASEEGITWLYYDREWRIEQIAEGVPKSSASGHWGSSNVDVGCIGEDPFAYIATAGPFHGNQLTVYVKIRGNLGSIENAVWSEHVLKTFANNNAPQIDGNGPIHHIVCADLDNDGDDEFLVSLRDCGIFYCKAEDILKGKFICHHVSHDSAARATIHDFNGDGTLDYSTIGYGVLGYFVADQMQLNVYYNKFAPKLPVLKQSTGKSVGGVINVSHGNDTEAFIDIIPGSTVISKFLIEIFRFRISILYMPSLTSLSMDKVKHGAMLKVIGGRVRVFPQKHVTPVVLTNVPIPQGSQNMMLQSDEGVIQALRDSTVLLIESGFNVVTEDVPIIDNVETVNNSISFEPISGIDTFSFKPFEDFWNMSGFTVRKLGLKMCHIQFWLADRGINCGIHDHSDLKYRKAFCEIHSCFVNGTGNGAMYRSTKSETTPIGSITREDMRKVVVPSGFEHGSLWEWDSNGRPLRREDGSVVYRAHAWIAGNGDPRSTLPSMDFWMATELNPLVAEVDESAFTE